MASIYTHNRFGIEIIKSLNDNLRSIANTYRDLFLFGNQGPDLYFFNVLEGMKKDAPGTYIHDRPGKDFIAKNKNLLKDKGLDSPYGAYMMGSICHFILDSHIHPYVNALIKGDYSHLDIESELDRYYMLKDGLDPFKFDLDKLLPANSLAKYVFSFYDGYPHVTLKSTEKAIANFKRIKRIFKPTSLAKEKFFLTLLKLAGLSMFNGQVLRQVPFEEASNSNEILTKIFDNTLLEAPSLLKNALDFIFHDKTLDDKFNLNYNGVKI
ncbi:zinc dependent phospholipase C family protein [Peptoniphilus sp. GNH]|nr:hypothetical protein HMPREF3189_01158 [Clostridiales bacterium KA00134]UHR02100.1 zinc dependent phospholipase C family protein [Peptoniphilus sp. GNH]